LRVILKTGPLAAIFCALLALALAPAAAAAPALPGKAARSTAQPDSRASSLSGWKLGFHRTAKVRQTAPGSPATASSPALQLVFCEAAHIRSESATVVGESRRPSGRSPPAA
jgi:hypothetical protein